MELTRRLIELYTCRGDGVLDPFAGVGTLDVGAIRTGRHVVCYDFEPAYAAELARERIGAESQAGGGAGG